MVPVPTREDKLLTGKPVTEAQLAFLTINVTTKQEVTEHLGAPNFIWEDRQVFTYNWEMRQGILFWMAGTATAGTAGVDDIPRRYALLIQFDDSGRVQRFERAIWPLSQSYADFLRDWVRRSPAAPVPSSASEPR